MTVFAIDPGNEQSAWCIMDDQYNLIEFGKEDNKSVMEKLKEKIDLWYVKADFNEEDKRYIDCVVIERVASYGMPVGREVFETCEWIGRFAQEAEKKTYVDYIYRRDEKLYLCFDSKAKDANIRAALIERFAKHDFKNGRGTKANPDYFYGVKADIWAAIAVATTFLDMQKEKKCSVQLKDL